MMGNRYSKNTASITLDGVGRTRAEVVDDLNRLEAEVARLKMENELLRMKIGEDMADQWAALEGK